MYEMNEYSITKYNPETRNALGVYIDTHEWTSYSDVGYLVLLDEFERIEKAYIDTAIGFFKEAKIDTVKLVEFDNSSRAIPYIEGEIIKTERLGRLFNKYCTINCGVKSNRETITFILAGIITCILG